jgi:hypothetical protein
VAQCSVNSTKLKVSSQVAVIPISSPLVIDPISSAPSSSEISVTLTIDRERISNLPTDEEFLHVPEDNLEFPCLAECIVVVNSLSAFNAEIKVEEEIPELVIPVDAFTNKEAHLDKHFSLFPIIPTIMQMFMYLFHICTLLKFELGRDPPSGDSRFGFILLHLYFLLLPLFTYIQFTYPYYFWFVLYMLSLYIFYFYLLGII